MNELGPHSRHPLEESNLRCLPIPDGDLFGAFQPFPWMNAVLVWQESGDLWLIFYAQAPLSRIWAKIASCRISTDLITRIRRFHETENTN